jgi:NADH-quinone oxidoreductase subunit G
MADHGAPMAEAGHLRGASVPLATASYARGSSVPRFPSAPDPLLASHHGIAGARTGGTVRLRIDGREVTAAAGEFLIKAAERAGAYIPRFCYHPRMKPVGMCRMCLVEVAGPRGATLQPACYLPVAEGLEVSTDSPRVKKAQDGVLEFLLLNHPLDCPVCDKGGECPLQDQTMAYGPGESRFVEEKRHFAKPIALSELVLLDRERCIQCGRCVRFAQEVSGEGEIDFFERGDRLEVNVVDGKRFESYFSGNTVQICPVGALTARPYRFVARPWDLDQVESTCTTCAFGCRVAVQSSLNRLTRLVGIDAEPTNQGWLCDKGRFVHEAANAEERLSEPLMRAGRDWELEPTTWARALDEVASGIRRALEDGGPEAVAVLGGARLTDQDAYAWAKLAKGVIGTDSVDAQLGDGLPAELVAALPRATFDDTCHAHAVLVLAGDLREELPLLFLRLRVAVAEGATRVVEFSPVQTALSGLAVARLAYPPGNQHALVKALLEGLGGRGRAPEGIDDAAWSRALEALAPAAATGGEGVVVVVGRPSLAERPEPTARAALELAEAWPAARFLPALRRGNVIGAIEMGLAPGLLPGYVPLAVGRSSYEAAWGAVPSSRGRDARGILESAAAGSLGALVLVGADPLGDFPDRALARRALERVRFLVALDAFLSPSSRLADVVLPVAGPHERPGTTTNVEGRVTRLAQKLVAPGQSWPDWMAAAELASRLGADLGVASAAEITDEIGRVVPTRLGFSHELLERPECADGILVRPGARPTPAASPAPLDPVEAGGIDSVERQGPLPRAGLAEPPAAAHLGALDARVAAEGTPDRPAGALGAPGASGARGEGSQASVAPAVAQAGGEGSAALLAELRASIAEPSVPPRDRYALRLVAPRRLYDAGIAVEASPGLRALVGEAHVRVAPVELERLGLRDGDAVHLSSPRGGLVLEARADAGVPEGVAVVPFNLPGGRALEAGGDASAGELEDEGGVARLIDASLAVIDVRLETVEAARRKGRHG